MNTLILDIETVGDDDFLFNERAREMRLESIKVPGNYKNPEAKERYLDEKMTEQDNMAAVSPVNGRVVAIGFGWMDKVDITCLVDTEPTHEGALLETFFCELSECYIGGWRTATFDVPFLTVRAHLHGIVLPEWWPAFKKYSSYHRDLAELLTNTPGPDYKLPYWLERFGLDPKTSSGDKVASMTDQEIHDYCTNDVRVERELLRKFYR